MEKTKAQLVELSKLACSVIIIGVGDEDFEEMRILDGDANKLAGAERDVVQFVEFNKACEKGALGEQVLAEIPNQFMSYMQKNNIPCKY